MQLFWKSCSEEAVAALRDALKIPRAGFHAFRHMHATLLLETDATPKVAQRQLRQADSRVTLDHYAHLIDSSHREAVERAATFLDRRGPKSDGSVKKLVEPMGLSLAP